LSRNLEPATRLEWGDLLITNRKAGSSSGHHYVLREINWLPGHLVLLYFTNATEAAGPASVAEWHGVIRLLHAVLGLRGLECHQVKVPTEGSGSWFALTPEELIRLRDHGVTAAYVRDLAAQGYKTTDPDELVRLKERRAVEVMRSPEGVALRPWGEGFSRATGRPPPNTRIPLSNIPAHGQQITC